ncbi:histidine phosphatase family protein [Prauserella flavalba]|uniref:Phosphoglycerate kinase n=1 Tax=Prauserella flavalba TaxID=1477506 RepID=A0A318LU64_9PSEU|nr:histidine phosphatase family protein [Prauserella flavalba]PXY28534.1 phosphoglycerate kinase [Prauserella flavalba]
MTHNEPAEPEYPQSRFQPPPGAARILLIRHGASAAARESEPFPLVGGQGDPTLAPDGHEQAKRVSDRLAGEPIAALYVTTLRRTVQTAAPLAERLGLTPSVEEDLREVHLGEWEGGLFRKHIAEGHPVARRLAEEQRWDVIPGAESNDAFAARVGGALHRLAAAHPDEQIAVFTHGGVIGQAMALASGAKPLAFAGAENGSISELVVTGEHWLVRRFNDHAHLD